MNLLVVILTCSVSIASGQILPSRSPERTLKMAIELVRQEDGPTKARYTALFSEPKFANTFRSELAKVEKKVGALKVVKLQFEDVSDGIWHRLVVTYQDSAERVYHQLVYVECPSDGYVWLLSKSGTLTRTSTVALGSPPGHFSCIFWVVS